MPFTVKAPVVEPPGMIMLAGETVAILGVPLLRFTVRLVVGAGETVTVPSIERPTPTSPPAVVIVIVLTLVTLNALLVAPVSPVALAASV
jgi:hypothetical protein